MRKMILAVILSVLVLSLIVAAGCGDSETIETPGGSVQVEQGNGDDKIVIEEGEESATLEQSQEAPSEEELGAPIYPGAEYDAENSGMVDYSSEQGSALTGTARFISEDGFSDVVDWYRGELGEPVSTTSETADWLLGDISTGNYTAVHIEKDDAETNIDITHMAVSME